jgi:hypothetical protein
VESTTAEISGSARRGWSGRPDLNRGPPAPKPVEATFGSPFSLTLYLKTKDLFENLVVAESTKM